MATLLNMRTGEIRHPALHPVRHVGREHRIFASGNHQSRLENLLACDSFAPFPIHVEIPVPVKATAESGALIFSDEIIEIRLCHMRLRGTSSGRPIKNPP